MKLFLKAISALIVGIVCMGAILFLPAGGFHYTNAWLFLGLLFVPMTILGVVLFIKSPALLEKRLNAKEKEKAQKGVIAFSALMFPVGFLVSAFDFRYAWSSVPTFFVVFASVLFLAGYAMYGEVMRENAYLSRTIEVQEGQTVVDTGLYGIVRHPMYLATFLMFMPMPLILGSFWGAIPFVFYPVIIVVRVLNEEKLLARELPGYADYMKKVKYRLIPFIW